MPQNLIIASHKVFEVQPFGCMYIGIGKTFISWYFASLLHAQGIFCITFISYSTYAGFYCYHAFQLFDT